MKRSVASVAKKVKKDVAAPLSTRDYMPSPDPRLLLAWYDRHRRVLPWRALPGAKSDPYCVWLSEIMLQQTTVTVVVPYYHRFVKRWPTIKHLAKARLADVMRMWAGLGYYRRARLLHECARQVVAEYDATFPERESELLKLPGFGPYTAAAVASIAFDRRASVVDGNVERVMVRIFAVPEYISQAKPQLRKLAADLLPHSRYGDYAQALMDLGATLCTPRSPKCGVCPWKDNCRAKKLGLVDQLPLRLKAKVKPVRRAIAFVLVNETGAILLRRRPKDGLLANMMEVPSSVWREGPMPSLAAAQEEAPLKTTWRLLPGHIRHVFSHFELDVRVAVGASKRAAKGCWIKPDRLDREALPSVMQKIVRHAFKSLESANPVYRQL